MHWYNKCDNGLVIWRDFSNNTAQVISSKVKFHGAGKLGGRVIAEAAKRDDVMPVSAVTGEGVDALIHAVAARLTEGHRRYTLVLDAADGAAAAWLHQHGEVLARHMEGAQAIYDVRMAPQDRKRFETRNS